MAHFNQAPPSLSLSLSLSLSPWFTLFSRECQRSSNLVSCVVRGTCCCCCFSCICSGEVDAFWVEKWAPFSPEGAGTCTVSAPRGYARTLSWRFAKKLQQQLLLEAAAIRGGMYVVLPWTISEAASLGHEYRVARKKRSPLLCGPGTFLDFWSFTN